MIRPTPACLGALRLRLTRTKHGNKDYYKGTGSGAMGRHTKHGDYVILPERVRTYVVPESFSTCKLTPYVTNALEPTRGRFNDARAFSGKIFLQKLQDYKDSLEL
ncbi:54S ribosomal protein L27, mitochondrial [Neolecta irregularis DAH-3]|uniref:54S ribosomal protein L27, mitochondrial n=1 Tax=Neolecta irregularis (strain DAH-3) TaxID=1198029 RepID=A0A1U7LPM9_NEOID|nr:54S ribosomal protein L27, mitochondrial [Neolecta irregularis DAH-3]|eukprot:OLL24604.1 54S ribosomal protein L27, mitochondrial [Neolecta irregularis DAH-3]